MDFEFIFGVFILAAGIISGFRKLPESERIIVARLGRVKGLIGPGWVWLMPAFDQGYRIDIDMTIPEWRALSEQELLVKAEVYLNKLKQSLN